MFYMETHLITKFLKKQSHQRRLVTEELGQPLDAVRVAERVRVLMPLMAGADVLLGPKEIDETFYKH